MQRGRLGGSAMIIGATLMTITMAFHPTGAGVANRPGLGVPLSAAVHAVAILAIPLAWFGALTLARQLSVATEMAELALGFYCLGLMATLAAATQSGFISPLLVVRAAAANAETKEAAMAVARYSGEVNQAYARILVACTAIAIGLWSLVMLRHRVMLRGWAVFGVAFAAIATALTASGRLPLDPHGFGVVVLAETLWLVAVGAQLSRIKTPCEGAGAIR